MNRQSSVARAAALLIALIAIPTLACDFSFSLGNASPTNTTAPTARAQAPTATARAQSPTSTRATSSSPTVAAQSSPAAGGGVITNAVLARAVTPLMSAPLGITDTFPPDGRIYVNIAVANAPSGTTVKAIWTAVNATGVPPNSEISSQQSSPQGTRNVDIQFYGTSKLPLGTYKIDILLNGKIDRTLNFTVKDGVAPFGTPTARALGSCVPVSPSYKPPLIARKITMAEGVNSSTFEPVNATRVFKPSSVFHAIVELDNAVAGTKIKAIWYATDTGGLEPCNTRLGDTEVTTTGASKVWFNFRPPDKWPIGNYKVDIYANDVLNIDTEFRVLQQ